MLLVEEVRDWQEWRSHGRMCLDVTSLTVDDVRHRDTFISVVGVAINDGGGVDDTVWGHWEHPVMFGELLPP